MAENDTVMTRDASAPRFVGGRNGLYADNGGNAADRAELISRQTMIAEQLRQAIANLPAGDASRGRLQAMLDRVRSLHPSQLTAELLNSIDTQSDAAYEDGISDASFDQSYAEHVAHSRYEREEQAYWHRRAMEDYYDNPYVGEDGRVNDVDGFARHHDFDVNQQRHHSNITSAFAQTDPAIHNNPTLMGLSGSLSARDPAVLQANMAAKSPADLVSNDMSGIVRNMRHMSSEDRKAYLDRLGAWEKSQSALTPEQRETVSKFRHLVDKGYLSPEAIADIRQGNTFNNLDRMRGHVDRAQQTYRDALGEAARRSTPEDVERLRQAAGQAGVSLTDTSGNARPIGDVLADFRGKQRDNPALANDPAIRQATNNLRGAMNTVRAEDAYRDVIEALDKSRSPEERQRQFYNKTPEQRAQMVENLYKQSRGMEMTPEMRNQLMAQVRLHSTPEQAGAFMAATSRGYEDRERIAIKHTIDGLSERAARGDGAAASDLRNLQTISQHVDAIRKDDPQLADRLSQSLRNAAYEQAGKTGTVDYAALSQIVTTAVAGHKPAMSGGITERAAVSMAASQSSAIEKANTLGAQLLNQNGVQAPTPPANETPMERAARLAKEAGATNSTARHNPETPPAPATSAQTPAATQEQAAEKAKEAATAAKAAGTTGGQEALAAQTPTGGAVRTASNGRAAGSV